MIDGDVSMIKVRKNGKGSAVRLLRVIEKANDALLGADEVAARIRRYVASHEAPANDQAAFERLCEIIFAQRIGFEAVTHHHGTLASAFRDFAPHAVAEMSVSDVATMLDDPAVRDRAKVEACLEYARSWQAVAAEDGTYLGRLARVAADDDAAAGWPKLVAALQGDFHCLSQAGARMLLKRWGFFTAAGHRGVQRVLLRLQLVGHDAEACEVQRFVGGVAERSARDPYAVETCLAIFAGLGPCQAQARCEGCVVNESCPSAGCG